MTIKKNVNTIVSKVDKIIYGQEGYLLQPSQVTFANQFFNVHEKRVIYKIISHLQQYIKPKPSEQLDIFNNDRNPVNSLNILVKELTIDGKKRYTETLEALASLKARPFIFKQYKEINGKEYRGETNTSLIFEYTKIELKTKTGYTAAGINIEYNKSFIEKVFLSFDNGFTKYLEKVAFGLSNEYFMNIYEYISHFRDMEDPLKLSVDNLMDNFLKLPKDSSYRRYPRKIPYLILNPAAEEIKNKSPKLYFSHKALVENRKVVGYQIFIHTSAKVKKNIENDVTSIMRDLQNNFQLSEKNFSELCDFIITDKSRKGMYLWRIKKLLFLKANNKINLKHNAFKYIMKSLQNDFSDSDFAKMISKIEEELKSKENTTV